MKCRFQTTDGAPEQFALKRFHTAPFCWVIFKYQTPTSDKLEKCVHNVVLLCSMCRNLHWRMFSFEENCCWSLRWICSIARYVWTIALAFQKWWLRHKTRRKTRNMENRQKNSKNWKCKHCWTKMIRKHRNNSPNNRALVNKRFQPATRDGKDLEGR